MNAKETSRYILLFYFLRQFYIDPLPFSFLTLKYLTWVTSFAENVTLQAYKCLSWLCTLIDVFTQKP